MMVKYIVGFLLNLFNRGVSLFAMVDKYSKVSSKAKVYGKTRIFNSVIGDYSYVGRNTKVVYAEIGKFCSIAGGSIIGMGVHTLDCLSTSPIFTEKNNATGTSWTDSLKVYPFKRVKIGNDVWIGARVMVMGGVSIGDGAVIGAGAIVTKDVPPYAIVVGVPAKVIRYRFSPEIIERLLNIKWWSISEERIKNNIHLFQSDSIDIDTLESLKQEI